MNPIDKSTGLFSGRSSPALLGRLSLMMFLQYFMQGAYLPIASVYVERTLGFNSAQMGYFVAALAVGPILAPFLFGQLVDRLFATQWVMAACHLVGGILMLLLAAQTNFWAVIILGTTYDNDLCFNTDLWKGRTWKTQPNAWVNNHGAIF